MVGGALRRLEGADAVAELLGDEEHVLAVKGEAEGGIQPGLSVGAVGTGKRFRARRPG